MLANVVQRLARAQALAQKKVIHAAEQDRLDVAERRAAWRGRQQGLDPDKLVFIDEFGANTKMTRTRGRAPIGERVVDKVPHGH